MHNKTVENPIVPLDSKFSEMYSQLFTPNNDAAISSKAPSAMAFKIFSLTNNNVQLSYSNTTKL